MGPSGLIRLFGLALSEDLRSLGKSGRRQRAGGCDQHKRATGDNECATEAFEEGRHHADLSYPKLLSIESGSAVLFWSDHAPAAGDGPKIGHRGEGLRGFDKLSHFRLEMGQFSLCESLRAMSSTTARATTPIPQNGTVTLSWGPESECHP